MVAEVQQVPLKMPGIEWPVSPWLIVGIAALTVVPCLVLAGLEWWLKWPWLAKMALFLRPGADEEEGRGRRGPRGRRGRRSGGW
jgi:hypothetical protein